MRLVSPLATWFDGERGQRAFRRRQLGKRSVVLAPRDRAWRSIAPRFPEAVAMAGSGLPFQIAADRRYDRSADRRRLRGALAAGATIFLPQVHQVLPRLMRLMVALRVAFLGPFREECSFLFLVNGRARTGMGLHHDGDVDSFWLQLEGRRTVTIGPPVTPRTPRDIRGAPVEGGPHWTTFDLRPGSLFYLPPRTPHEVVCHTRSLALSLTWGREARRRGRSRRDRAAGLTAWDVASGPVCSMPRRSRDRLWTQIPTLAGPTRPARRPFMLWTADGARRCLATVWPLASQLALMPSLRRRDAADAATLSMLIDFGILAPQDLPLRIVPDDSLALDGWDFQ
ncbi:MAG: JmjC domain-containing protein [Candidatus Rokuibacteriota bacterium]